MAHDTKLNTFHLFAGAGGGILADLLLGHNPIGACEIEEYPRSVLLARQRDGILPEFPIWDDVRTLDGRLWRGTVDVLCGGFPCQDISSAGKGEGITGERSGLWKEYARLIGEMRPRFVFAENSPLLRTRGLGVVLEDLAALGYDARWGVLGARDVGAPHKRDRMWVLAYAASGKDERRERRILEEAERSRKGCDSTGNTCCKNADLAYTKGERIQTGCERLGGICRKVSDVRFPNRIMSGSEVAMAYADSGGSRQDSSPCKLRASRTEQPSKDSGIPSEGEVTEGQEGGGWWHTDPAEVADTESEHRRNQREDSKNGNGGKSGDVVDAKNSDPAEGAAQPILGRVAHGVADRVHRLKAIGNGQVPQCAALAFNILSEGLIPQNDS